MYALIKWAERNRIMENLENTIVEETLQENVTSKTPLEFAKRITDLAFEGFKITFEEFKSQNYQYQDDTLEGINSKFSEILDLSHWILSATSVDINCIKDNLSIEFDAAKDTLIKVSRLASEGIEICEEYQGRIKNEINELFNEIQLTSKLYLDEYILNFIPNDDGRISSDGFTFYVIKDKENESYYKQYFPYFTSIGVDKNLEYIIYYYMLPNDYYNGK